MFVCQYMTWCEPEPFTEEQKNVYHFNDTITSQTFEFSAFKSGQINIEHDEIQFEKLADVLKKDTSLELTIIGPYYISESTNQQKSNRNIGIQRAQYLAQKLNEKGVNMYQLDVQFSQFTEDKPLFYDLKLNRFNVSSNLSDSTLITSTMLSDSTILHGLHFESNSTALQVDEKLSAFVQELLLDLEDRPNHQMIVVGHTDNQAQAIFNDSLGLWRAQAVAAYIRQMGYDNPISSISKGENEPIAPNHTKEGRFKNRRVELIIKTN